MSSGFVSGGTVDKPNERDDIWLKAQQEIEATRRRNQEAGRQAEGKSLFETLQQNKVAKQDAFEESIKLKNQFRTLDEDEIEFLDTVLESTRAKEEAVKKETSEQLDVFRQKQEEAEQALRLEVDEGVHHESVPGHGSPPVDDLQWTPHARKRKRVKEKEILPGVKLRKSSSTNEAPRSPPEKIIKTKPISTNKAEPNDLVGENEHFKASPMDHMRRPKAFFEKKETMMVSPSLGLGTYDSEDD